MIEQLTTSKKDLNIALKAIGLQAPKSRLNMYKEVSHRAWKGIRGGSIGPMTSTNAHMEHNRKVEQKVIDILRSIPGVEYPSNQDAMNFSLNDGKKVHKYYFSWHTFRTYAHNEYDPSYQTYWLILNNA